jgi:hypothetical protein
MITLPDSSTSDEEVVTRFLNSEARWQVVTDGPDAKCPTCGYPERHRIYDVDVRIEDWALLADGCPSCESSRIADRDGSSSPAGSAPGDGSRS